MKKIILFLLLIPMVGFNQGIRYSPIKVKHIAEPFGMSITNNSQVFVEDSNYQYKILSAYTQYDSMTTVIRDSNYIILFKYTVEGAPVTGVLGELPIVVSGTTTSTVSITKASTTDSGYLSTLDWNTFNDKVGGQAAIGSIPRMSAIKTIETSIIYDNGTTVRIDTGHNMDYALDVHGGIRGQFWMDIDGTSIHQSWIKHKIGTSDSVVWVNYSIASGFAITRQSTSVTPPTFFWLGDDGSLTLSPVGSNYTLPRTAGTAGQILTSAGYGGAFTWTTPSVLANDSMVFYYNAGRNSAYLRSPTARVAIGANSTANTNRRFHVQGSMYVKDSIFFESGTYLTDIGQSLYSNYGASLMDLTLRDLPSGSEPTHFLTITEDGVVRKSSYASATGASLDSLSWYRNGTRGYVYLRTLTDKVGIGLNNGTEQLQITNNFRLPHSTDSLTGVIKKGGTWFMHDYGAYNTFLGLKAGNFSLSNGYNTGIGYISLNEITTGSSNTALGYSSGYHLTTGSNNTLIGYTTGYFNTTGSRNTSVGDHAGAVTEGNDNVSIGYEAGYGVIAPKTGHGNIAVGSRALYKIESGYDNIAIGDSASILLDTKHNTIAIGAGVEPTASDQAILGNSSITTTILRGTINVNNTPSGSPVNTLGINSNGDMVKFASGDSLYRYFPLNDGTTSIEVLATAEGITATLLAGVIQFTIPAGARVLSAKIRIATLASVVIAMGTNDMLNSDAWNRWMPLMQAWREDTGAQLMGANVKLDGTNFTRFTVQGLVYSGGSYCQIRLGF